MTKKLLPNHQLEYKDKRVTSDPFIYNCMNYFNNNELPRKFIDFDNAAINLKITQSAILPVSAIPPVAVVGMRPGSRMPYTSGPWPVPTTLMPGISSTAPNPVAIYPDISFAGRYRPAVHNISRSFCNIWLHPHMNSAMLRL